MALTKNAAKKIAGTTIKKRQERLGPTKTAKRKNERNTEDVVRNTLRDLGYYDEGSGIRVDSQKSEIDAVTRLLRGGSKSRKGGSGYPEFLITNPDTPDFIVVIECKASTSDHASAHANDVLVGNPPGETDEEHVKRLQRFAVDGVLHYAELLSKEYNVIAVAVSGETKGGAKFSVYLRTKGSKIAKKLPSKTDGSPIEELLSWEDFIDHAVFDPAVRMARLSDLMEFARELHVFMRDHAKLTESQKPLLVSGTLIALRDPAFAASYSLQKVSALPAEWLKVIRSEINAADIPRAKKDNMAVPYSMIAVHPELAKATKAYPKGVLYELIRLIYEKAKPFIVAQESLDILGQFYGEFLKYTGGDKKALGIVLTPRHITELFAELANVHKKSTVVDICAGTGGFLIAAMSRMMRKANSEAERSRIKKEGLIGIEQQPDMFALAASNMILRGDGKANLYQGSCFNEDTIKEVRGKHPDVGMLNPPFSQSDADQHELKFIQQMLSALKPGGTGIAIVPMSCAISPHPIRHELLKEHTLEAVMSMPTDLFYPVGVVTCIMVFTAHKPHSVSDKKSWFGYWKEDGFVKTKHMGRVDLYGKWPAIRDRWVEQFRNHEVHAGESVLQKVSASDEWCAEAYMETDYSALTQSDFERVVQNYAVFKLLGERAVDGGLPAHAESK